MVFYGIVFLVAGAIGWAFHSTIPRSRPLSTLVMYVGIGVGVVLLAAALIVMLVSAGPPSEIDVNTLHQLIAF